MAVTKKKLSSYGPAKSVDELKDNPDVFIPIVEKDKNNYILPLDDLLNNAENVAKIYQTDLGGREYTVDELKFIRKSANTVQIKGDSTNLGSTVPLPSIGTDEGKVPVAYYRDGRGYFILEKYKDGRFPDSDSTKVGQVLTVDAHGVADWAAIKTVPDNGSTGQVLTRDSSNGYGWQNAIQPIAGYNMTQRANDSVNYRPYFDVNYVVKYSAEACPSMYSDTTAHETEFNLANGQLRCKISYASKPQNSDYNSIRFQFKVNSGRDLTIFGTYRDHMPPRDYSPSDVPDCLNIFNATHDTNTYIGLYSTIFEQDIGFTQFADNVSFAESLELHLSWINTKNFRMDDRITITRFHDYARLISDNLVLYENYSTLTNSSV